jgi:hypothetical protein
MLDASEPPSIVLSKQSTMSNLALIDVQPQSSPFDSIRHYDAQGLEFWKARELMKLLGYIQWRRFDEAIERAILSCENSGGLKASHFNHLPGSAKSLGRSGDDWKLSKNACRLIAMNGDPRKIEIASAQSYFSAKVEEAEVMVPTQNDRIRELELLVKLSDNQIKRTELTSTLVAMHGESLGLAIAGFDGQIIEKKTTVTEVLNPATGSTVEFLSADQLAKEVKKRSGQKTKNAEFIRQLKAANRDDLIVPVTRSATYEYVCPDTIDEAILVVYGSSKQMVIS